MADRIALVVDGREVEVADSSGSLLEVLREQLGIRSVKDGCSPQGQCGCCTVLVDGQPRVSCVTPARRVAGRSITTIEGLSPEVRTAWGDAFCATGGSQCGFCTPGIIMRFEGLRSKEVPADDDAAVEKALAAHLCRCTGWRTVVDAFHAFGTSERASRVTGRDLDAAAGRAALEGGCPQRVGSSIACGAGGFADDTAPPEAMVAVIGGDGEWVVAESLAAAREQAGKVQGRRTTVEPSPPLPLPDGQWHRTLRTSWVEPAYLETDASWCAPGGEPASPLANGGAFGGKVASAAGQIARRLAAEHGRTVRVLFSREDAVRLGPKRPPMAIGIRSDGSGVVHVARAAGIADAIRRVAPTMDVVELDVPGPPVSTAIRAAGWAEALVVASSLGDGEDDEIVTPDGGRASARVVVDDTTGGARMRLRVSCGRSLDEVVLRSYCIGAAHMAMSWVTSESLVVDGAGVVHDLTIRSFDVLRALDTPPIDVEIVDDGGDPVNGSDAVFAAVAAATWRHQGFPPEWPTRQPLRQ